MNWRDGTWDMTCSMSRCRRFLEPNNPSPTNAKYEHQDRTVVFKELNELYPGHEEGCLTPFSASSSPMQSGACAASRRTPTRLPAIHLREKNIADSLERTTDSILYNFPGFFETNDESATLHN